MRVAVTGATGFLGSHLCARLVADGHEVVALRRRTSEAGELARLDVETVVGEVTERAAVRSLVHGCDAVFHAAAEIRYGRRMAGEHERINVGGTGVLADACARLADVRLVHVSSVAAIGLPQDRRPADEGFRFNAERLSYHRSKRAAEERVLQQVGRGLDAVIGSPSSILGPWQRGYRGSEVPRGVARRRLVPHFVGGTNTVYVADVVEGMLAALSDGRAGERYILGGENLSWREMAQIAAEELGLERTFVPVPAPLPHIRAVLGVLRGASSSLDAAQLASRHQYYDSGKASAELGYRARGYREIVRDYLDWAAAMGSGGEGQQALEHGRERVLAERPERS